MIENPRVLKFKSFKDCLEEVDVGRYAALLRKETAL